MGCLRAGRRSRCARSRTCWPHTSSAHKLAYIVVLGLILGIAWSLLRIPRPANTVTICLAAAACILWLAQPKLKSPELTALLPVALLWAAGVLAMVADRSYIFNHMFFAPQTDGSALVYLNSSASLSLETTQGTKVVPSP